jgi:NAD(P)H-hydrate epimerase
MRTVTASEMQALDQMAIHEYAIPSLLLMENAGRGVADIISREAKQLRPSSFKSLILCGKGNNGGDGLVAARHLANRGFGVEIVLFVNPANLKEDPAVNFSIVSRMKIPFFLVLEKGDVAGLRTRLQDADFVIDALFGVGLKAPLTDIFLDTVYTLNGSGKKVISVDIPSGLDADTGRVLGAAVKAAVTATLALPKKGLYEREGPIYAGEIQVVDIGLPREIL